MDIRVFDCEHGDSSLVLSREGEAVLIDCGYNSTTKWRPSDSLARQGFGSRRRLHHLILTHPDQDHLADLAAVKEQLKPAEVWQHPQLRLTQLTELKATLSRAQEAYLANSKSTSELQPLEASRKFKTMELRLFYLPLGSVRDINDLSLVSFITEGAFTVCFPGDLTKRGWRLHLTNPAFRYMLRETNLLIASHHGRPTGYYAPVFEFLHPRLIILSNKESVKGRTALTRAPYRDHARGVPVSNGTYRRVLTTADEGRIRVQCDGSRWHVSVTKA